MDHPVFDHDGPWTEDAYLGLSRADPPAAPAPDDGRIELVDGALVVGPGATRARARVVEAVRGVVEAALPEGLCVTGAVPLRMSTDCVLVPDLVVTRAPADGPDAPGPAVLDAADALMVIEVVGADHGAVDRSFKPQLYARSRIPYSLVVDHDAGFAVANMIINGRYHDYAHAAAGEVLRIEEPFGLAVDLAAVTAGSAADQDSVPASG